MSVWNSYGIIAFIISKAYVIVRITGRKNYEKKQSIENFFRSEWFMVLTDIDGEKLIKKLRREEWK